MSFGGHYNQLIQPDKLDVLSLSVLLDSLTDLYGGIGANIAYNSAQLGEQPVLLGSVGTNTETYLANLAAAGVNVSAVHTSQLPTATFTVMTDADHNQVSGFYPGAMADADSLRLAPWAEQDVFVCLSAHDPIGMRNQLADCQQYGLRYMYDPGQQVSTLPAEDLRAGIAAAEIVAVNDYEYGLLCQRTGLSQTELEQTVPLLIVTHSKAGSTISGKSLPEPLTIGIAKAAQAVDPTGAGDAYRAGFLYGYLRQWDVKQCAQLASVVASFILEQAGTQVPLSRPAITQRYQETYSEEIEL
jgi:adenosine kinase